MSAIRAALTEALERSTPILTTVGAICLAVAGLVDQPWTLILAVVGAAASIWVVIRSRKEFKSSNELKSDLAKARQASESLSDAHSRRLELVENALKAALRAALKSAGVLNSRTRITAFVPNERDFRLLVRVSQNLEIAKRGRETIPGDESVMSSVWLTGETVQTRLSAEDYVGRRMSAKSVIGRRLDDPVSGGGVALVIIESTEPQGVNNAVMKRLDDNGVWERIEELVRLSIAAQ